MGKTKLRVGVIGCGTIGSQVARACQDRLKNKVELTAICDTDKDKAVNLVKALKKVPQILDLRDLIKRCDLVVEAASAKISGDILSECVRAGRDCMIMSVGGLVGREDLLAAAKEKGAKVYIPSGALCGVDGLKSASAGRVDSVSLTTRKPVKGLAGAPYLEKNKLDLSAIKDETVIFEGSAEEAIKGFPQNVNVSAVLSLAGLGAKKTCVRIVTSPQYTKNIHEVEIKGECGNIFTRTENVPSKANPKTSELAVLSAIATLDGITNSVRVGT
ncbi:MAG: aspartate dehydrogenase [Candidatus Omnitrophica bacterium]|nr:aspartate dehydrogenase [Candidatus Omnitrophota bacterium]